MSPRYWSAMPVSRSYVPWRRLARLRSCGVGTATPNPSNPIASAVGPQLAAWYSLPSNWLRMGTSSEMSEPSIQPRTAPVARPSVGSTTAVGVGVGGTAVGVGDAVGVGVWVAARVGGGVTVGGGDSGLGDEVSMAADERTGPDVRVGVTVAVGARVGTPTVGPGVGTPACAARTGVLGAAVGVDAAVASPTGSIPIATKNNRLATTTPSRRSGNRHTTAAGTLGSPP